MNSNTQLYDKSVDRAAMIRRYEKQLSDNVTVIIDGHAVRVEDLVRKANLSTTGFKQLREAVDQEILKTMRLTYKSSKSSLLDLAKDQISYMYQNVETVMSDIWETKRPPIRIAEDFVLKKPLFADSTLEAGWHNVGIGEKKRIEALIRKGMAEGQTVDQMALDLRKGNVFNITRNQSKALVTTGVTSVTNQADMAVYEANKEALQGWQYVAILDSRTTAICAHRDGSIYDIGDYKHLPPSHYNCRSRSVPVVKSWEDLSKLDSVSQVRKRNLKDLTPEQRAFYDGQTPLKESYAQWLSRQSPEIQFKHLGDYDKVELFRTGGIPLDKFYDASGQSVGIRDLRSLSYDALGAPGDSRRFALAKEKLDAMRIGAVRPEDFFDDLALQNTLRDYYLLQAGELDGLLSLTNYRGITLGAKRNTKRRVLMSPPREDQLIYNPLTNRYEDSRRYIPNAGVFENQRRLVMESTDLLDSDKKFITDFVDSLSERMSMNERSVVSDNLRVMFTRYRKNGETWGSFKGVSQSQIKFDVMNISDSIETQLRKDTDFLKKLTQDNYIDPVLGQIQLQDLHDRFIPTIFKRNRWEDSVAPKIARELRGVFDPEIPPLVRLRLSDRDLQQFYLKFAHRLGLADTPDKDQLAAMLGRDLYNLANLKSNRKDWFDLGTKLLESKRVHKFYKLETFGVQKRRMKSRMSGQYFGPYYDTISYNIRITDPRIAEYAKMTREVDLGIRLGVTTEKNKLHFRKGYKTYFVKQGSLYKDTRIPITSTSSFSDFPAEFIDDDMVDALNWAGSSKYRIDPEFHDFIKKLIYFEDDRGQAAKYNDLNLYRQFLASRGDAYERFKAMEWLRSSNKAFSNHPFIDHRARIYERGLIGPQSGETFRPFLNTSELKAFSENDFHNFNDQIGAFLGGLSDKLEGRFDSLTITGRQKIAQMHKPEMIKLGNHMLRGKPADIRAVLDSPLTALVDAEEQGKFFRLSMELAKIDRHLKGDYSKKSLLSLKNYKTALALEQDASSSGAQIIALTTRNKQLAEMSNVVPTMKKKRLYDEIAARTFVDPRFQRLNLKLGLSEKDLRKAAKAQNMVNVAMYKLCEFSETPSGTTLSQARKGIFGKVQRLGHTIQAGL